MSNKEAAKGTSFAQSLSSNNIAHCFYYQGVGTYGGWFNRFINQGLAFNSWDVSYILNKARKQIGPGDILVVHDNQKTQERLKTLLPGLIDIIEEKGLKFETISA